MARIKKNNNDNFDIIRLNSPLLMQLLLSNYNCINNDKIVSFQIDNNNLYYNEKFLLNSLIHKSIQQLGYTLLADCFSCTNIKYWYNIWFVSQYISDTPECLIDIKPNKLDFMTKVLLIANQLDTTHKDLKEYCHQYIGNEIQQFNLLDKEALFTEQNKINKATNFDSIFSNFYYIAGITSQNQMNKLFTVLKAKGNIPVYVILLSNIILNMNNILYTLMIQTPAWIEIYSKIPLIKTLFYETKNQTLEQYLKMIENNVDLDN